MPQSEETPLALEKSRRAYVWQAPDIPTADDLRGGGARRRAWLRYWLGPGKRDAVDLCLHRLLTIVPIRRCSDLGGLLGRLIGMRTRPDVAERVRARLRRIRPGMSHAAMERNVLAHFDNAGRLQSEFSILSRIGASGRLAIEGADLVQSAASSGPTILVCCHIGNWEMLSVALHSLGISWAINYRPPARHSQRLIAERIRRSFGATLLPPGSAGARPAIRHLQGGGIVSIFADEVHENVVMAPFFDRTPHLNGNLAVIARMRRLTGAKLLLAYSQRLPGCKYLAKFNRLIEVPSMADPKIALIDDVKAINAAITPVILANTDQWYFLDNAFE